jgi:YdjC-like protein
MSTRALWKRIAHGILTATTLMANGAAFDDAPRLARQFPPLDIGRHLVLIGGCSLVTQQPFPVTVPRLVATPASRRCGHSPQPSGHPSGPDRSGSGGASGRGIRYPVGAPALRFSAPCAGGRGAAHEAVDLQRDHAAAAAFPSRAPKARLPHQRPFRRLPNHRPFPRRRAG